MALVDVAPTPWPPIFPSTTPTAANMVVDAADEVAAMVFRVRKAGTVTRAHFRTGTVTTGGTSDLDIRLETVDGSGLPTGTLFGANTNVAFDLQDADDNVWLRTNPFTGSAVVAAGDLIALVIVNPSSNFGNFAVISGAGTGFSASRGAPYTVGPTRATKVDVNSPICALEYDDGSFCVPAGCFPARTLTTAVTLTTATNPDEAAVIFTPQLPMRVVGWHATLQLAAAADYRVSLYQSGNNTPLLTRDYDGDAMTNTSRRCAEDYFGGAAELAAGTTYRLGFLPLTANNVLVHYIESPSTYLGLLDEMPGKQAMHYSSRNRSGTTDPDAAAWTEITNRRLLAGVIYDRLDDGAGGGGGGLFTNSFAGGML